jgi:8-oxo-dGTP pyrophosphatase MutT (NUDIX family)
MPTFSSVYQSILDHLQSIGIVRNGIRQEIESLVTKGVLPGTIDDLYFLNISIGFEFTLKKIFERIFSTKKQFRFADIFGQSPSGKDVEINCETGSMFHSLHLELAERCPQERVDGLQKSAHQFSGESASRSGGGSAAKQNTFTSPLLPSPPPNLKIVGKVHSNKISHSVGILFVNIAGYLEMVMVQEKSGRWGFPGGQKEQKESAFYTLMREYTEEVNDDLPQIDGTNFGTHEQEPLKCVFHHDRSDTNTAIYLGMVDSKQITRMICDFRPKQRDPEILAVRLVPIAHVQQMVEGKNPGMNMRYCAKKSTEAVLRHLNMWHEQ